MAAILDQDRASQIDLILRQVDSLPTLSPIATRLMEITNVEDTNLDRLVEVLEADPALTAKLLGLCRKADKGLGDRITTVRRAVVMLGLEAVQAAVLSVTVYDLMQRCSPRIDEPAATGAETTLDFDRAGFWMHSVAVASASELIAAGHVDLGVKAEEAFVAGLLHDLGKLVLDLILPRSYARVLGLAERRASSATDAELQLIGLDHHTAGKRLGEHWGLPPALCEVMWLHGQPIDSLPEGPNRNLIGIVSVARTLCRHLHLGWSGDFNHPEPLGGPRGICRQFGLSADLVESSTTKLHDQVLTRCKVLGLDDRDAPEVLMQSLASANRRLGRLTAMFDQRSRSSLRQARVLTAISEFQERAASRRGRDIIETLAEVVRSAAGILGQGFFGVLYQPREGEAWQLSRFASDGRPLRSEVVETPPGTGSHRVASLAELCRGEGMSVASLSLLPWLTDYLVDAGDLRKVQLLSLSVDEADSPAAVLLHDRDVSGALDKQMLDSITKTWAGAIGTAILHDSARRLAERLVASNRSLAEAQQRLAESESMARLGEMAAGAAHEMNNPLTVINGRAQLLASKLTGSDSSAAANAIVDASQQLSDLITSLRLVAAPPEPKPREVSAEDVISEGIARAKERTKLNVPVDAHFPRPAPKALLDKDMIVTALAEVIANAMQASAAITNCGPVRVRAQTTASDRRILFVVEDSGPGMSARALQHAFDPFFSERAAGRGTGLGLTRARRLVELLGGEIVLRSKPGQGTTATVGLAIGNIKPT